MLGNFFINIIRAARKWNIGHVQTRHIESDTTVQQCTDSIFVTLSEHFTHLAHLRVTLLLIYFGAKVP